MDGEIILLTGEVEGPHLGAMLHHHNPALSLTHVQTKDELERACFDSPEKTHWRRLIAFCTSIIVPATVLDSMDCPAYNFHPGPPTHPGTHPASFAIYENAPQYGVTVHEMAASVDSGTIVATEWFDIPDKIRFTELEIEAYKVLVSVFQDMSHRLATDPTPLPPSGDVWSGTSSTRQEFEHMREVTAEMDEAEITRRFRSFG